MRYALILPLILSGCSGGQPSAEKKPKFTETISAQIFYKGNIHAHTVETDGDSPPRDVVRWYKKKGYNFLAITDHDKLTCVDSENTRDFIMINGVEITGMAANNVPVHANAICGKSALKGVRADLSPADIMKSNVASSQGDGAITLFNHPNFGWAFTPETLLGTDGFEILEIASGHPLVNDQGDSSHPAAEEPWDIYMSKKHRVYAAAVDDAHDFKKFSDKHANPGRAWIQAWAPSLTKDSICTALRNGHFYSSTGTKINALVVTPRTLELSMDNWNTAQDRVDFIGAAGALLATAVSNPARYTLQGGEGYVRAHIVQPPREGHPESTKREAWTQAYFIKYE